MACCLVGGTKYKPFTDLDQGNVTFVDESFHIEIV